MGVGGVIPKFAGVTVLMRYTCGCSRSISFLARGLNVRLELMQQENPRELGTWPFEIGLWVGSGRDRPTIWVSRETNSAWSRKVLEYEQGRADRAPVPLEKCPWCGAGFKPDSFHLHPDQDNAEELRITCLGRDCDFTGDRALPIHMVDEPIYHRLPGFLIATVDKFAGMPWKGEIAKLFGRVKSYQRGVGFLGDCDGETGVSWTSICLRRSWSSRMSCT